MFGNSTCVLCIERSIISYCVPILYLRGPLSYIHNISEIPLSIYNILYDYNNNITCMHGQRLSFFS